MQTQTSISYDNVLAHVAANAKAATSANFTAIASGTLAYLVGYTWADKADKKAPEKTEKTDKVEKTEPAAPK